MASPSPTPVKLPGGFVRSEGPRAASGRYVDGDKVRFVRGLPEKIGGWTKYTTTPVAGIARGIHGWNDLASRSYLAVGTTERLYFISGSYSPQNITPFVGAAASLTGAFTTIAGSITVIINKVAHGLLANRGVNIAGAGTVAGIVMDGDYQIATIINVDSFAITAATAANATVTAGGSCQMSTEILPGAEDPASGFGYGVGAFGMGAYGTPRTVTPFISEPRYWSLDNFGKILLAAPYEGGLYAWDPTVAPVVRPALVAADQAPGTMRGMFVTEERFVICYGASPDTGSTTDSMLLRWCHQGDYARWDITDTTSTAGQRRVNKGKRLVGGTALANAISIIWSDVAAFVLQYTGSRFVFDLRLVGTDCGLFGPQAFTLAGPAAYWVGPGGFYVFNGGVSPMPNSDDVREWVFGKLRAYFEVKTVAFYNSRYREVWFLFVPAGQSSPAFYAAANIDTFEWITGTLERCSAARARADSGSTNPIMASTDGFLYTHETSLNADGAAMDAWIKSGVMDIGSGAADLDVLGFMPDFQRHVGNLELDLTARDRSATPAVDSNSVTVAPGVGIVDLRLAGRLVDFRLRSNVVDGDFRMGVPLFETKTSGGRR